MLEENIILLVENVFGKHSLKTATLRRLSEAVIRT
jgi:hypothetical protein